MDTLRADHLGCYGYEAPTSPSIDRLRAESVLFEQAIAQAPSTLSSHASLLTSRWPHRHGASYSARTALAAGSRTLAEHLSESGFRTAAFHGAGQLDAAFGLDRGFEAYDEVSDTEDMDASVDAGVEWLETLGREERFFLFLHSYEVHHPYDPESVPEDLAILPGGKMEPVELETLLELNGVDGRPQRTPAPGELERIVLAYDAEIRAMDAAIGRLLAELRRLGRLDDTLIVLVSDHGEEFGERGWVGWHSHSLYQELLRVPLLMRFPRELEAGGTVRHPIGLVDVVPTVLDLLAEAPLPGADGISFSSHLRGGPGPDRTILSKLDREDVQQHSLRRGRWKWAHRIIARTPPRDWLFDLDADPTESVDLSRERISTVEAFRSQFSVLASGGAASGRAVTLGDETVEDLRALGYLD